MKKLSLLKATREEVERTVKNSHSFREVALKLNYSECTPNLEKIIREFDVSHFTKSYAGSTKYIDCIGLKFNKLLVLEIIQKKNGHLLKCLCDCGREKEVKATHVIKNRVKSCGCLKDDILYNKQSKLIGQKRGSLTITEVIDGENIDGGRRNRIAKCLCDCGKTVEKNVKTLRAKRRELGCGHTCKLTESRRVHNANKNCSFIGSGEIGSTFFNYLKTSANKRGIEFYVSINFLWELFLKQERKCALSGMNLIILEDGKSFKKSEKTASLDRIDSSKGYTEDNVQWVHKHINVIKNSHSQQYFIELCTLVSEHNKGK